MNKNDLIALSVLIALLFLWTGVGPQLEQRFFPPSPTPEPEHPREPGSAETPSAAPDTEPGVPDAPSPAPPVLTERAPPPPAVEAGPKQTEVLANDVVELTFSSHGANVEHAVLKQYFEDEAGEEVLTFDFEAGRPLSLRGLKGFEAADSFTVQRDPPAETVVFQAGSDSGLVLTRRVTLDDGYLVHVLDSFSNPTTQALTIPSYQLQLGEMGEPEGESSGYGVHYVGVDALVHGGKGVEYFGDKVVRKTMKKAKQTEMEGVISEAVDWIAVNNRFFTQILTPNDGGDALHWFGRGSLSRGLFGTDLTLNSVAAAVELPPVTLEAGQTYEHASTFYLGPKKYTVLHQFGRHQEDVMNFGFFSPICKFLLLTLNVIHDRLWPHNYGIAIMFLTVIIRVLFWPVTHKGTDSMRRMQDIQPLMKELQAKYKDNPQKLNAEMMKLYKEHKVNPMMGCLPMLVQIPVFIALFVVLRSAIELRFAEFLWISDLSEPEDLLAGIFPFGGLRILPIFYAVSMLLQQKIMPMSGGNPQQEKIMQFMPIMMLFIFYNFASGLVLYWITNQALMLTQQGLYQRRKKRAEAMA